MEEIEDNSGVHEYLCVDALIWKRKRRIEKSKMMALQTSQWKSPSKKEKWLTGCTSSNDLNSQRFACWEQQSPCFESASLEMFSCDGFKQQLAEMMQEFKEAFTTAQPSKEVGIHPQNYSEGGEEVLEQKVALMAEFGLTTEMLDFNIDDFSVEELREKFEALKTTGSEPAANAGNPESFALEGQFRDELFGALESEKVETCWGMDSHYWFWDYDRDASEVYATDVTDWNLYGFPYSMDGDHVVIDFAGKKRMKLSLVPFDEGGQADPISGMFAKITEKYSANDTQWAEKYQTASDTISSMENELGTLRQFKTDTEDAAAKGEREKVFAQFEDLVGVEAFENLREHCTEYAVDVLEEKCYAIRGRNGTAAKFSVEPKSPKLVVEKTSVTPEPYGGVFTEYGIASRNQHN